MKYISIIIFMLCFFTACKQPVKQGVASTTSQTKNATSAPDIKMLRQRLFHFFETHQAQDEFDTTDDTYVDWGGAVNYVPYGVRAGHLFSEQQLHAIIYYNDEQGWGLTVYKKDNGSWQQIYRDSSTMDAAGASFPSFTDWNHDGQKDIDCLHRAGGNSIEIYDLWLVDKSGDKIYPVDSFNKIPNPEVNAKDNHVISYSTCGCADNCMLMSEYKFKDYRLEQLYALNIGCCAVSNKTDSECEIKFTPLHSNEKISYCNDTLVYKRVPQTWRGMMYEKYNQNN